MKRNILIAVALTLLGFALGIRAGMDLASRISKPSPYIYGKTMELFAAEGHFDGTFSYIFWSPDKSHIIAEGHLTFLRNGEVDADQKGYPGVDVGSYTDGHAEFDEGQTMLEFTRTNDGGLDLILWHTTQPSVRYLGSATLQRPE